MTPTPPATPAEAPAPPAGEAASPAAATTGAPNGVRPTGQVLTMLVSDIVDYNWRVATGDGATWRDAVGNGLAIAISPPTLKLFNGLREFC